MNTPDPAMLDDVDAPVVTVPTTRLGRRLCTPAHPRLVRLWDEDRYGRRESVGHFCPDCGTILDDRGHVSEGGSKAHNRRIRAVRALAQESIDIAEAQRDA